MSGNDKRQPIQDLIEFFGVRGERVGRAVSSFTKRLEREKSKLSGREKYQLNRRELRRNKPSEES